VVKRLINIKDNPSNPNYLISITWRSITRVVRASADQLKSIETCSSLIGSGSGMKRGDFFGGARELYQIGASARKNKTCGFIRTYAIRMASKTAKPDNNRITTFLVLAFRDLKIVCRSALRLCLHPAGLEPETL
jgi:hypothetical protein